MLEMLIIFSPVILGCVLAILNSDKITNYDERLANWFRDKKKNLSAEKGKFSRFFLKLLIFSLVLITSWTQNVKNNGIRSGIRLASYLYISVIAAYIFFIFASIMIGLAIVLFLIWLALTIWNWGDTGELSAGNKVNFSIKRNKKYDPKTGERIITQDGKTYCQSVFGNWKPDTNLFGSPKVETDTFGNPKIERDWTGKQKVETDWKGDPIIPPDNKNDKR